MCIRINVCIYIYIYTLKLITFIGKLKHNFMLKAKSCFINSVKCSLFYIQTTYAIHSVAVNNKNFIGSTLFIVRVKPNFVFTDVCAHLHQHPQNKHRHAGYLPGLCGDPLHGQGPHQPEVQT